MIIYKEASALKRKTAETRQSGKKIGFVPTMGALHSGHMSLIAAAKEKCDVIVCSIFVNPTQFNDPRDYEKYPKTIDNDIFLAENAGCHILFLPAVAEIYPAETKASHHYDLGNLEYVFEGKYRPGHFQGVCQVVHRLLDIVSPDFLFLGQKDYQQCQVIKHLVQLINCPLQIITVSTVRENTGLAMSSRNLRLTEEERRNAAGIFKMLTHIKTNYRQTAAAALEYYATNYLLNSGFDKVDYVAIADANSLEPVKNTPKAEQIVALIAASMGDVRLIDNMILTN